MAAAVLPGPYRRVLGASALSNLSDGIRLAAFPLLAVTLTTSPFQVGLVATAGLVPGPLFGLWAGWLSDRFDRRLLTQATNAMRSILLLGLAAFVLSGWATIPLLMVAAFVLGATEVLADNSLSTLVPSVVDSSQLEQANSRMVASEILGNEFIGPALGSVLFGLGLAVPFISNAGLLAASVLLLAGLPMLHPVSEVFPPGHADIDADSGRMRDGLVYLSHSQPLRSVTMASALLIAIDGAWFALLVILNKSVLGHPDFAFGFLLAGGAVGGLAGSFIADRFSGLQLRHVTVGVFATMAISLIGLGSRPTTMTTVVVLITTSGAFAVWNVFAVSARQRLTPNHLLGRVTGAYKTIVLAAAAVGTILGALTAEIASIQISLLVAGSLAGASLPLLWLTIEPASSVNRRP